MLVESSPCVGLVGQSLLLDRASQPLPPTKRSEERESKKANRRLENPFTVRYGVLGRRLRPDRE